jgi:hypothetical protein
MNNLTAPYYIILLSVAWTSTLAGAATATKSTETWSQGKLFVDDSVVANTENIRRVVHPGEKHPAPVLRPTQPCEGDRVYTMGTAYYDAAIGKFRLWYMGRAMVGGRPADHLLYAVSDDGIHWHKPHLGLHEFQGSSNNNILLVDIHSPSVVVTQNAQGRRAYKLMAMQYEAGGYVTAASPDGIQWKLNTPTPAIKGSDNVTLTRDPCTGEYLSFHRQTKRVANHGRRSVFLSRSVDFKTWSKPVAALVPDAQDDRQWVSDPRTQRTEFYNMTAAPYRSHYLGFLTVGRFEPTPGGVQTANQSGTDGPIHVELVHSRDGSTWNRLDERPAILAPGPADWDQGMILALSSPIVHNDEVWIYYTGFNTTHGGPRPPKQSAIGRAKWRLDGFVSLRPRTGECGLVETRVLDPEGQRLYVNADAQPGSLTVELLDEHGRRIPGYSRDECLPIETDQVRAAVRWRNHDTVPNERPFAIRFCLNHCDLFSFTFGENR